MRIHLIAVGGAVMHALAISLKQLGHTVSGSDDVINDPSRSKLKENGLLPVKEGFVASNINRSLDLVILGMHAKKDNPELQKSMNLGLSVLSFPQFIYEHSKNKKRVVIAGSHGKTSVTAMIMHVLKKAGQAFDYLLGSKVDGFDGNVRLSTESDVMLIEGDEYLASALDLSSKFHAYKPSIAIINGIAWDHINVFPTYDSYLETFRRFIRELSADSKLFYFKGDKELGKLLANTRCDAQVQDFSLPEYSVEDNQVYLINGNERYPIAVFGAHNLQNMMAAKSACLALGVNEKSFYSAIADFKGAGKRLELLRQDERKSVYIDFAHAPSKVKASVNAVNSFFSQQSKLGVLELHTFSSLNLEFITGYAGTLNGLETAVVFIDDTVLKRKGSQEIDEQFIKEAFCRDDLLYFTKAHDLKDCLLNNQDHQVVLLMSSGSFGKIDLNEVYK